MRDNVLSTLCSLVLELNLLRIYCNHLLTSVLQPVKRNSNTAPFWSLASLIYCVALGPPSDFQSTTTACWLFLCTKELWDM